MMNTQKMNKRDMLFITRDNAYDDVTDEIMQAHAEAIEVEKVLSSLRPHVPRGVLHMDRTLGIPSVWLFLSSVGVVGGIGTVIFNNPIALVLSLVASTFFTSLCIATSLRPYISKRQPVREFFARMMFTRKHQNTILQRKIEYKNYFLAKESYEALVESKRNQLKNTMEILTKNSTMGDDGAYLSIRPNGVFDWINEEQYDDRNDYLELSKDILEQLQLTHQKLSSEVEK